MFGLPAAALAMIHVANKKQRKIAFGILSAAGLTAFLTGVTEPLEFAFMFVAFPLYIVHAVSPACRWPSPTCSTSIWASRSPRG